MKYCSACGQSVHLRIPEGDNLPRHVCDNCGAIHYQNPKIVAGCIPIWEDRILLCRRAIEPRHGLWTLPAGFMENRETTAEAAARETLEEACAQVVGLELYGLFNIPHISQVYVMFRGRLDPQAYAAGSESIEVGLFHRDQIPWREIAFQVVHRTLDLYFSDLERGEFGVHVEDVAPRRR